MFINPKSQKIWKFIIGIILGIIILIFPISQLQTSPIESLQTLAVQLDGRKKPLDTVARETLIKIHGKTNYQTLEGEKIDYLQTYLSLWFNNRDWNQEPFILLNYHPLKQTLNLDESRKYFTFEELVKSDIVSLILEVKQKQAANLDLTRDDREIINLENRINLLIETVGQDNLPIVPHPNNITGKWLGINEAKQYYSSSEVNSLKSEYSQLKQTYQLDSNNLTELGRIAKEFKQKLINLSPNIYPTNNILVKEVNYSKFHFFNKALKLYIMAFILLLVSNFKSFPFLELYTTSLGIFTTGLIVQSYGFLERVQIANRPPVTNMYESVVWVGFGIAVFALIFELFYRNKYYILAAAPLAILCLAIADNLPTVLDSSIQPLVPVLRDNFWLSIHVPTITLGYANFALAMGLGHIILGYYLFKPQDKTIQTLSKLNYKVLQMGVLLLTAGIILGGIWAHFSWGRFWGWDPKETWALIALISYLVPIHGRLAGWLTNFGIAVASVVCFNAVLMAWYGVNFVLGTGLHSYGFTTGGSEIIVIGLVILDLIFVLVATIRAKGWLIFANSHQITENN